MIYNSEERIGVYSIAKIFAEKLKWIFREQPINDFGIDGFVEITKYQIPIGKLFGVQIKSGKSFFKEVKDEHFVYRGSMRHLKYWVNHSIPVILIIYDKDSSLAYWREINTSTVIPTEKSFKVQIPKKNLLSNKSREQLADIAYFKNDDQYKFWQLQTSGDEVKLLINQQLFLYVTISYPFYLNDYCITLLTTDENCDDYGPLYRYDNDNPNRFDYSFYLTKGKSLAEAIKDTLPWADILLDNTRFTDELLTTFIASEILSYDQQEFVQDVLELKEKNDFLGLACYLTADIYSFKLDLKANELTYAFLTIDSFLNKEPIVKQKIYL